jgi:hypothetical protein
MMGSGQFGVLVVRTGNPDANSGVLPAGGRRTELGSEFLWWAAGCGWCAVVAVRVSAGAVAVAWSVAGSG